MKRKIWDELLIWKNLNNKMPLMLLGARQVGKTYILKKFCEENFDEIIYVNLLERNDIVELYKTNMTADEKFLNLKLYLNCDIENKNKVIFIDEIQESEELISSLKYLCEKHSDTNIVCAGSLLGVKLKRSSAPFPVGKVYRLTLYPMSFEEFLIAIGEDSLVMLIKESFEHNKALLSSLHEKCLNLYRKFLCLGGMPAIINDFIDNNYDLTLVTNNIKKSIVDSYFDDMTRYVHSSIESIKINKLYNNIPFQLLNDSRKFQISKLDTSARARDYENPIDWLLSANLIYECWSVTTPQIPLADFNDLSKVKYFINDVGLFIQLLNIDYSDIVSSNISLYKGVIAENYVACELISNNTHLFYINEYRKIDVDFLYYANNQIIPIEVKAEDNTKSKSLNKYIQRYKPSYSIRISSKNFGFVNDIKSVPLYAVFCIK